MDVVWMKVTYDDLSLPLAVAGSMRELAKICGVTENCITTTRGRYKRGEAKRERYIKVVLDD